jgi:hypothetical protein
MKVYVSKKDIEENDLNFIEDTFIEKYWLLRGDSEDGVSFDVYGDVGMVEIETLEQHDAEIRKQAKQEVVEEVLRLVNTLEVIRKSKSFVNGYDFAQEQIKQKLNEIRGGEQNV